MSVLLTGFAPFAGETVNPSWDAIERLSTGTIAGHAVETLRLPCVFQLAAERLEEAIAATTPSVVISVGQAGGRSRIGIERVAINIDDCRHADESGAQPVDAPVVANGPDAYFATVPVKSILARLMKAGIPAEVSNTAGTFVCNHVFYLARHLAETRLPDMKVGFLHVPFSPLQAVAREAPSMSVTMMRDAVALATEVALTSNGDILLAAGSSH
ncbi:pyrrolidone-carboxylate peptidase [Agaricicola taiwanensis]|uniref:Pyroglutamyl-peptidase I n=1 Tax=Agaricicola taiwanensis TaxID=591372 RepID=A0A8J2YHC4_9RHOB|nr:pyroglutamyl-peptidase I [Agaricicola taiwanensis]GGE42647.1 pyrrolidone-carboxylate peptidase [Agaricicola taiwanensis]